MKALEKFRPPMQGRFSVFDKIDQNRVLDNSSILMFVAVVVERVNCIEPYPLLDMEHLALYFIHACNTNHFSRD